MTLHDIETAKCTLSFYPISSSDIAVVRRNMTRNTPTEIVLKMAFHKFLNINMAIPPPIIQSLDIMNIKHKHDQVGITVQFCNVKNVKTIFRYVKNLSCGLKVSPVIPAFLSEQYDRLQTQAYYLRNGLTRHQTVIKFLGNTLALYARAGHDCAWQLVPDEPDDPPVHQLPVPQVNVSEN